MGRKNPGIVNKLLVVPLEKDYAAYDFHIESIEDAKGAAENFGEICRENIRENKKAYYCSLALEEIVFNIVEYQKNNNEPNPSIDVHIVVFSGDKMVMRIKDCSTERNPFVKYEYSSGDGLENLGIQIVKSFAQDIKYSFIYGVNFITITV
jgi:anti-sigma regulatory factor (Ser/Thr protein kinase)